MAIHARCEAAPAPAGAPPPAPAGGAPGGLHLDGTVNQFVLLWRIWKENIAREGRTAAGALGVWGLLSRSSKVKHIAVDIAPLVARVHEPAESGGSRASQRTLAVLSATRMRSSVAVTLEKEDTHVALHTYMHACMHACIHTCIGDAREGGHPRSPAWPRLRPP